jgi:hypothetical protein
MRNPTKSTSPRSTVRGNGIEPPPLADDAFDNLDHIRAKTGDTDGSPVDQGDIFDDLEKIRLDPAAAQISTAKQLLHVPVRKPKPQEFFRVNADPAMSITVYSYHDDDEREFYLVLHGVEDLIKRFVRPVTIVVCINRQGSLFLWPTQLPTNDRRSNAWITTARAAMELAKKHWVSLRSDMGNGCYEAELARGKLPEPDWPDKTLRELLRLAFVKKVIDSDQHPKVQDLWGLV